MSERTDSTGGSAHPNSSNEAEELIDRVGSELHDGLLPLRVYNDDRIHKFERQRIFGESWIFIGHESEIPDEGDYARRYIGQDPFIFIRDEDGEINVLFDSCRHHGTKICDAEQGNTSHFRCPYHGWTYDNSGDLIGVPQKHEAYKDLEADDWGLVSAPRIDTYHGLVFASIAEKGPSLEEHLGDFAWYLDLHMAASDSGMEVIGEPHRWELDIDWKSGADNFSGDSYHTQITHMSLFETGIISPDKLGTKAHEKGGFDHVHVTQCDGHSSSIKIMPEGSRTFWGYGEWDEVVDDFTGENLTEEQFDLAARSLNTTGNVFPNFSFIHIRGNDHPDNDPATFLSLRKWQPLGPGKMQAWSWILVPASAPESYKERAYKVGMSTFSPAGNFEQDDFAVWDGIATAANSEFARKHQISLNYQMGLDGMSAAEVIPDWPGPGVVYDDNLEEGTARTFHEHWYRAMSGGNNGN
ncbi:Ring hydroxylating alpha subunit (catalytic domain) [Halopenitus malekzadehii]|uniref:Ring hydroxylating alpha subunit (Catalytic domain) n=1 Tax=Halopenitus malekzadehii TaxID=1267564 RepID=A0A1H6JNH1_9EURY|nr:Rieske 2Fe-2S domain-containing protein [Halopenitus malekzadehii]SEH63992.1 Ring hydroxylating alpha subunit (catalytic domain) [Halopenitus malekzadehii]